MPQQGVLNAKHRQRRAIKQSSLKREDVTKKIAELKEIDELTNNFGRSVTVNDDDDVTFKEELEVMGALFELAKKGVDKNLIENAMANLALEPGSDMPHPDIIERLVDATIAHPMEGPVIFGVIDFMVEIFADEDEEEKMEIEDDKTDNISIGSSSVPVNSIE